MNKKNIIVFREKILLPSEGFIKTNYLAFDKIRPLFIANEIGWNINNLGFDYVKICNNFIKKKIFKINGSLPLASQNILLSKSPKLIHAHFGKGGALMLPFANKKNLPLYVTFHGADATKNKHFSKTSLRVFNRRRKDLIKYSRKFICVSEFIAKQLIKKGFPSEKIFLNYIGIEIKKKIQTNYQRDKNKPLLFIGRLVEKKGVETLIKAINSLKISGINNIKLNIIGEGPLENHLKKAALNNKNISFLGWKNKKEIISFIKSSSALVVPSQVAKNGDSEGLPTVLLEGVNEEIPIIATNHAGIPELIKDSVSGFICEEANYLSLAKKIKEFFAHQNLLSLTQIAKKKLIRDFDAHQQSQKLQNLFLNECQD